MLSLLAYKIDCGLLVYHILKWLFDSTEICLAVFISDMKLQLFVFPPTGVSQETQRCQKTSEAVAKEDLNNLK